MFTAIIIITAWHLKWTLLLGLLIRRVSSRCTSNWVIPVKSSTELWKPILLRRKYWFQQLNSLAIFTLLTFYHLYLVPIQMIASTAYRVFRCRWHSHSLRYYHLVYLVLYISTERGIEEISLSNRIKDLDVEL